MKKLSPWRKESRRIIQGVIKEFPDKSIKELRKEASKRYPFGMRKYHPYKQWLVEVNLWLPKGDKISPHDKERIRNFWITQ